MVGIDIKLLQFSGTIYESVLLAESLKIHRNTEACTKRESQNPNIIHLKWNGLRLRKSTSETKNVQSTLFFPQWEEKNE